MESSQCLSTRAIHTIDYDSTIKRSELLVTKGTNIKCILLNKKKAATQKRLHITWFHIYEILKTLASKNKSAVAWANGGEEGRGWPQRGKQGNKGWWKLTTVMAAWLCTFTQTHLTGCFKWVNFIAWKTGLKNAILYKDIEEETFGAISSSLWWPGGFSKLEEGLANRKGPYLPISVLWLADNPGTTNITSCCSSGELSTVKNPPWPLEKG